MGALWIGREVSTAAFANLEKLAAPKRHPYRLRISRETSLVGWGLNTIPVAGEHRKRSRSRAQEQRLTSAAAPIRKPRRDASRETWRSRPKLRPIRESDGALRSDVLKVGHHSRRNSTIPAFLAAVHPCFATISAGEGNPYGHPSPELVARLEIAGVRILRTDRDGAVHVLTGGTRLEVSCFVPCSESAQYLVAAHQIRPPENP